MYEKAGVDPDVENPGRESAKEDTTCLEMLERLYRSFCQLAPVLGTLTISQCFLGGITCGIFDRIGWNEGMPCVGREGMGDSPGQASLLRLSLVLCMGRC